MKHTGKSRSARRRARAGQALAELVAGLIGIVVLIMGMLLIEALARTHTYTMNTARAQAGQDAIMTPYIMRYNVPTWISDWVSGQVWNQSLQRSVNTPYSQKDTSRAGNPGVITGGIVAHADPTDLSTYAPGNEISAAATTTGLMNELFLTHGREKATVDLNLFPIIHHIVYAKDSITMQGDAWLTWTHIENVK